MTSTLPPIIQAFSGAIGSISANTLTYPLDLVTTKLQLDSPQKSRRRGGIHGASLTFRHIFRDYGLEALYDGLWADSCATLLAKYVTPECFCHDLYFDTRECVVSSISFSIRRLDRYIRENSY